MAVEEPMSARHNALIDRLLEELRPQTFGPPVAYVYNPLAYARAGYEAYFGRFGTGPKEVLLVGMNPGPWGMVQTGVPFGDIEMVRDWMGIEVDIAPPDSMHPKRQVMGFSCPRSEVSGKRLWGWAKKRYGSAERFFARFFVGNYCPLAFIEKSGKNRTPDALKKTEKKPLFDACDRALKGLADLIRPRYVVGIGNFAAARVSAVFGELPVATGRILHPSPASPKANRNWADTIERELSKMGIRL